MKIWDGEMDFGFSVEDWELDFGLRIIDWVMGIWIGYCGRN